MPPENQQNAKMSPRDNDNISVSSEPQNIQTMADNLRDLIRRDHREAKGYLKHSMTKDVRKQVTAQVVHGQTCLSLAVHFDAQDLVVYLIEKCGCSVEQRWIGDLTWDGETHPAEYSPLVKAVTAGNVRCANILLKHGADIDAVNDQGFSALHAACAQGEFKMADYLIRMGANVNLRTRQRTTCLMNARKCPEIREALLNAGAVVNKTNSFGRTALHQAAMEGCVRSVKLLLRHGANISAQGSKGNTALHLAVFNQHADVVRELTHKGADIYVRNLNKEDAFLLAAAIGNIEIQEILLVIHRAKHGTPQNKF